MNFPVELSGKKVPSELIWDAGRFHIRSDGAVTDLDTPLVLDNSFEGKDFEVHPLISPGILESNICQFFHEESNTRVGWVIPMLSLESDQHDCADNKHFLRYAYIAIREGVKCLSKDIFLKKYDFSASQSVRLSDIFHESTAFLVVSRETLVEGRDFDLERALPSLISQGYVPLT